MSAQAPRTPTSVTGLIDSLGGYAKVAVAINRRPGTVAAWRTRNYLPVEEWPSFIALAKAEGVRGITADALLAMNARPANIRESAA